MEPPYEPAHYMDAGERANLIVAIRRLSTSTAFRKFTDLRERGAQLVLGGHCSSRIAAEVLKISEASVRRAKDAISDGRSVSVHGRAPALSSDMSQLQKWITDGSAVISFPTTATIASKVRDAPLVFPNMCALCSAGRRARGGE